MSMQTDTLPSTPPTPGGRAGQYGELARLALAAGLAYAACLVVRFLPAWHWDLTPMSVDGNMLLATNDAYYWLAGAKGFGSAAGAPMAHAAAWLADITGASLENVAFWTPPFAASLVAVATALWCWTLGAPGAGFLAGVLACLAPSFYTRTNLGYYDTDLATLLMPLLMSWGLAHWLAAWLKPRPILFPGLLGPAARCASRPAPDSPVMPFVWIFLLGLFTAFANTWHERIPVLSQCCFYIAVALVLARGHAGRRGQALWGLVIFVLAGFLGEQGATLALLIILGAQIVPEQFQRVARAPWVPLAAVALLAWILEQDNSVLSVAVHYINKYLLAQAHAAEAPPTAFPSIYKSISEASRVSLSALGLTHPWVIPVLLGGLGYLILILAIPTAALLLPLAGLFGASIFLATRLAMFGAPVPAIGLAVPLAWVCAALARRTPFPHLAQGAIMLLITAVLALPYVEAYGSRPPHPVVKPSHARALMALGEQARSEDHGDACVWTWWDYGYAAAYYSELMSFTDGGDRHQGEYVFPLGLALTTPSPLQAAQVIQYSAIQDYNPSAVWKKQSGEATRDFLEKLKTTDMGYEPPAPQYLVVTPELFNIFSWVTYYGTWDPATGTSTSKEMEPLLPPFDIDRNRGFVRAAKGVLPLASIDVLSDQGGERYTFPDNESENSGHLLVNLVTGQYSILDKDLYETMAIQLLMTPPGDEELGRHFRLVYEGYPEIRIFEVR